MLQNEFLVDLQSGELFVKLKNKWHPAGLTCKKRNFEVDSLMALIQHASIKLKNKIYGRKEEQTECFNIGQIAGTTTTVTFYPKSRKLRETRQTDVTSNEKELHQGQGSSGSDIHNGVWQHQIVEFGRKSAATQTNTTIANSVWQGRHSKTSGGRGDRT